MLKHLVRQTGGLFSGGRVFLEARGTQGKYGIFDGVFFF